MPAVLNIAWVFYDIWASRNSPKWFGIKSFYITLLYIKNIFSFSSRQIISVVQGFVQSVTLYCYYHGCNNYVSFVKTLISLAVLVLWPFHCSIQWSSNQSPETPRESTFLLHPYALWFMVKQNCGPVCKPLAQSDVLQALTNQVVLMKGLSIG